MTFKLMTLCGYLLFHASLAAAAGQCSVSGKSGFRPGYGGEFCQPAELSQQCTDTQGKNYCVELGASCDDSTAPLDVVLSQRFCKGKTKKCVTYDVMRKNIDGACMAYVLIPPKGGNNKDVKSSEPPCGESARDASKCQYVSVLAPTRQWVVPGSVQFLAKENSTDCADPSGYAECKLGLPNARTTQDCGIGYAKWNPVDEGPNSVDGRFKNWSHDRPRCAAIKFKLQSTPPR